LKKYGKVLDLLGHSNLVIADSLDSPKLFFLDPDGIDKLDDMNSRTRTKVETG